MAPALLMKLFQSEKREAIFTVGTWVGSMGHENKIARDEGRGSYINQGTP